MLGLDHSSVYINMPKDPIEHSPWIHPAAGPVSVAFRLFSLFMGCRRRSCFSYVKDWNYLNRGLAHCVQGYTWIWFTKKPPSLNLTSSADCTWQAARKGSLRVTPSVHTEARTQPKDPGGATQNRRHPGLTSETRFFRVGSQERRGSLWAT